ncbi:helix-turn-helix domain-containing protein [Streptomyces sp. NPDC059002]|uniref:helix-turn-helix domain-containing protein n=1 Tax=Streptomyces sp. NPDC059002 TaxID=3346690 RepID=UPI00367A2323
MSDHYDRLRLTLKHRRISAGLSVAAVADRAQVSESTVWRWEEAVQCPGALNLARWAHAVRAPHEALIALVEADTAHWAALVAGEYQRAAQDRTGTIRTADYADAVALVDGHRRH